MPSADEVIGAADLSLHYPGRTALEGVELQVRAGSLTALVGANGSGKTSLLRLAAGLERPSGGRITVLGGDPASGGSARWRSMGYLVQDTALDPEMTGRETLRLFATLHGVPWRDRAARQQAQATRFGLEEHAPQLVSTYSGGLKRRLHLAAGLLADPELLLADEPATGLDRQGRELLWDILVDRRSRGRTSLVATHDLPAVGRHCDDLIVLRAGRVKAQGEPGELLEKFAAHDLESLFYELTGARPRPLREVEP